MPLQLEAEGIRKFVQPHEETLSTLRERIAVLRAWSVVGQTRGACGELRVSAAVNRDYDPGTFGN